MKKKPFNKLIKKLLRKATPLLLHLSNLWIKSLRFDSPFMPESQAIVICIHEELIAFTAYGCKLPARQRAHLIVLTSMHRDGSMLDWIFARNQIQVVRGSSSKGGMAALHQLFNKINLCDQGKIVFAVDGPRGPRRKVKPGVVLLAKRKSIPVYIARFHYRGWRLSTAWDKHHVPWPFAKIKVSYSQAVMIERSAPVQEAQKNLERIINTMD